MTHISAITRPSTRTTVAGFAGVIAVTIGVTLFVWSSLPEEMIVRWDASGQPDATLSRSIAAFVLPLLLVFLVGLFVVLPRIDPLGENIERFRGDYNGFFLVIAGMLAVIQGIILAENIGYELELIGLVFVLTGIVVGYSGLLLRVAEPNWFVGIRTPWTLSSDAVWYETHRVGSILFVLAGVVIAGLGLIDIAVGIGDWAVWILLSVVLVAALVPTVYSYYLYATRDTDRETTTP